MSLLIPIFVGGGEGGRWFIEFPGGGYWKRESLQILDLQRLASHLCNNDLNQVDVQQF